MASKTTTYLVYYFDENGKMIVVDIFYGNQVDASMRSGREMAIYTADKLQNIWDEEHGILQFVDDEWRISEETLSSTQLRVYRVASCKDFNLIMYSVYNKAEEK